MRFSLYLLLAFGLGAQTVQPQFEVASIRAHVGPLSRMFTSSASGPRIDFSGYKVAMLVLEAYGLKQYQMPITPAFQKDDTYYDIAAKAEDGRTPTQQEFRAMLRDLLAKRFRLEAHREQREMPVYLLTDHSPVARHDG